MRIFFFIIFALLAAPLAAQSNSVLNRLSRTDIGSSIQIFAYFDNFPEFTHHLSGKRLDITLNHTSTAPTLLQPASDEIIIKALTLPQSDSLTLSFFFRYVPQEFQISKSVANTLIIDIEPGNKFTRTFKELSSQLGSVTVLNRRYETYPLPPVSSPYSDDWRSFIAYFETDVSIKPNMSFYLPTFPLIRLILPEAIDVQTIIPKEIVTFVEKNLWFEAISSIQRELRESQRRDTQKYLALTHAELLLRLGNFEAAQKQLTTLKNTFSGQQIGVLANYTLCTLLANNNDPYSADFELRDILNQLPNSHHLKPHVLISLSETALASGQLNRAQSYLELDSLIFPPELEKYLQLRMADVLYAKGKEIDAYRAYLEVQDSLDLTNYSYSLSGFCSSLYAQEQYQKSAQCYQRLTEVTTEPEQAALSMYRSVTSMINQRGGLGAAEQIAEALKQVISRYPETEAAIRSSLKQTDLCYLQDETCADSAQQTYRALAEISVNRSTREEAYFKEALLYHLTDKNDRAIELLMTMLRNFRSGSVRPHAETLLVRLLPNELDRLLSDKNYIKAIALAQQNRNYFENGWFDSRLLENLGLAYEQLEIYQEALHIFLYLRGVTGVEEKERLYLDLTRISHAKGDNYLVEDFSSEYFYNYPNGLYHDEILFYRTDSLYAQGLVVQALELLPEPLPDTIKYKYLAAAIHYQKNDYVQAIGLLLPIWNNAGTLPEDQLFIMADSFKKLGRSEESRQFFSLTKDIQRFRDYSLFQLAGLSSIVGNEIQALSHLQKISDSAINVQMQRLARQEIEFQQLAENL